MHHRWTKQELHFLIDAMDQHHNGQKMRLLGDAPPGANDKVQGDMSIPKPVTVDVNGTMSADDYKACSMVMTVCQNMVQQTLRDAAKANNIPPDDALKNMGAWVKAYVDFPFPFFNFKDTQSDTYKKDDFSITSDPDVVEQIVNIKNVDGLKDAVIGALKSSGGNLASYEGTDRDFKYFGVITGYNETDISTRVIKFEMHMKTTKVDSLCVHYTKTELDTAYDTYQFTADKELMIKMQAKMGDQMVDYLATKLLQFAEDFYDQQFTKYKQDLADLIKAVKPTT